MVRVWSAIEDAEKKATQAVDSSLRSIDEKLSYARSSIEAMRSDLDTYKNGFSERMTEL
jgi:hypothetical protein